MIEVFGRKSSANVQKVHWICFEGNIDFKSINVGGKYGGHDTTDFKKLNPNSTIPVLKDNDFIIYESNSIIKYISDKFDVLKSDHIKEVALNNQWIDWASLVFGLPCAIYTAHNIMLPIEKRDSSIANEAKQKILNIFELLNQHLEKNNFIISNKLSLADIPIGCWMHRCVILNIDYDKYDYLKKWYKRLKEMSAFDKAVVSAPLPPN